MQISILSGIYTDQAADVRVSYPRNVVPVSLKNGVSAGYLKTADGLALFATGQGVDRGGILWNGVVYRVSGTKLIQVGEDGVVNVLGDVGGGTQCALDYSFDRLIINSGPNLYYYTTAEGVKQVTDPDLGPVVDAIWIDGYTMTTDGTSLVVTELLDPTQVDPIKYGSAEIDPDPITGLIELRNEVYVMGRYTIEVFDNVGGNNFPFARIEGATVPKGCVGPRAKCLFAETIAFLGSGRNEATSIYMATNGRAQKIGTTEIDRILATYTEFQLASVVLESRVYDNQNELLIHLPNETLVYNLFASQELGQPVWYSLHSDVEATGFYRGRNFVFAYNKWICGDTQDSRIGYMVGDATQYGEVVGWQIDTSFLYNESRNAIIHSLELVANTGRANFGTNPTIFHSWTDNGVIWSNERTANEGKSGNYSQRIVWRQLGLFRNYRGLRFRGANDCKTSFYRLEAQIEALNA